MTIRFGTGSAVEKCSPWYPFSWGSKRPNPSDLMGDCAFSHYMFMFKGLLVEVSWLTLDVWAAGRARDPSACPSLASLTIREVYYLWLFVPQVEQSSGKSMPSGAHSKSSTICLCPHSCTCPGDQCEVSSTVESPKLH